MWSEEVRQGMMATPNRVHSALTRVRPAQLADALKILLRVRRAVVCSSTGHRFWIDPVSIFGTHLSLHGVHEPQMTRLVMTLLRGSDVFIDIGANEGYFSVIAASCVPGGAVHSIEPQTRLQEPLRRNLSLNDSSAVVHKCAIADTNGSVSLFLRPSLNTGASSMFHHWKLGSRVERVPSVTLDTFFQRNGIDRARFIKVDCEGAEPLIIRGAENVLRSRLVDFIALEYHPSISGGDACRETHERLTGAGYRLTTVLGQTIYHLPLDSATMASLREMGFDDADAAGTPS